MKGGRSWSLIARDRRNPAHPLQVITAAYLVLPSGCAPDPVHVEARPPRPLTSGAVLIWPFEFARSHAAAIRSANCSMAPVSAHNAWVIATLVPGRTRWYQRR